MPLMMMRSGALSASLQDDHGMTGGIYTYGVNEREHICFKALHEHNVHPEHYMQRGRCTLLVGPLAEQDTFREANSIKPVIPIVTCTVLMATKGTT